MQLRHLATTSKNGGCPELYATDRHSYVVQGTRVTEPALLALLADGERLVEIPQHLFALASLAVGGVPGAIRDSGRGTYLVRGAEVTDPQALKVIRERGLPGHETVVEIAVRVLTPTGGS